VSLAVVRRFFNPRTKKEVMKPITLSKAIAEEREIIAQRRVHARKHMDELLKYVDLAYRVEKVTWGEDKDPSYKCHIKGPRSTIEVMTFPYSNEYRIVDLVKQENTKFLEQEGCVVRVEIPQDAIKVIAKMIASD
jgi:hypothetical protein